MKTTTTYFDLNIPTNHTKHTIIKLIELGYTSFALTRTIKGVMSDQHISTLSPPLSLSNSDSILSLTPSVSLHRDCLSVPRAQILRQYTRLTVCVETLVQAQALNSGNFVLKSYDLVGARPFSLDAFEHVCYRAEVDIISIDFSVKLPFRLKLSSVEAAVKRGVYFEITYSGLIANAQTRQQIISSVKLLVKWTRGRNIILSSGAISACDLRGPVDVANLASLLGLSMERARDAISKNCRNLITNSLRKKKYYKEAIKVELVSPSEPSNFSDWLNWDPISSGDGDLQLDDIAKSFAASGKVSKTVNAIDFGKFVGSMPSNGFRLGNVVSGAGSLPTSLDEKISSTAASLVEVSTGANALSDQHPLPESNQRLFSDMSSNEFRLGHVISGSFLNNDKSSEVLPKIPDDGPCTASAKPCDSHVGDESKVPDQMDVHNTVETNVSEMQSRKHIPSSEVNGVLSGDTRDIEAASVYVNSEPQLACLPKENDCPVSHMSLLQCTTQREPDMELSKRLREDEDSGDSLKRHRNDADYVAEVPYIVHSDVLKDNNQDSTVVDCEPSEEMTVGTQRQEEYDTNIRSPNLFPCEPSEMVIVGIQSQEDDDMNTGSPNLIPSISGKQKPDKRRSRKAFLLPLKRMLSPTHYKKKAKKHRSKCRMA